MNRTLKNKVFFLYGILMLTCGIVSAQKFTIPVIPDTQENVTRKRGVFFSCIERPCICCRFGQF